jgi:hypothetical protein
MYNSEARQTAADVYHNYLEDAHCILDDFNRSSQTEAVNKMNIFWNQLRMASGARYIYSDSSHDEFSFDWLNSNGKNVIDGLITDAGNAKSGKALSNLKNLRKILEEKHLIN